jgi:uncharacterized protein
MSWLLDGNLLFALLSPAHDHHQRAMQWWSSLSATVHTCSVVEGTYIRLHMQFALDRSATSAWSVLARFQAHPLHVFLDDGFSYTQVDSHPIQGHRQVTDAWLAELARRHGAKLATLDAGLATTHGDVAVLIP